MEYINKGKKALAFWPTNSSDKVNRDGFKDLDDPKMQLQYQWNRLPKWPCRNLVKEFKKKVRLIQNNGERMEHPSRDMKRETKDI